MNRAYRVLVFDNNTGSFDRLKRMSVWQEKSYEIIGKTAEIKVLDDACRTGSADLVICYNRPPLINTESVIAAVKRCSETAVCIAVSPFDDSENMRKCFIMGAVDYLTEPVSENRLREALVRASALIDSSFTESEYQQTLQEYLERTECSDVKFLHRLHEFLAECENMTVSTEYAADWFGFNKDYFGRMFKQKMGLTFGEFYKLFRIRYAEKLLASGRYKVYEVSEQLGFSSVDYFTSVFKRVTGTTPSQLKKI